MAQKPSDEDAYNALLQKYSKGVLADFCGIRKQNLTRWKAIPAKYVPAISKATGIPKAELLPSFFD